jgi:serine/threonine protein kinase
MPRKVVNGRTIYQSHNDFGPLRSLYMLPKLADFGLARRGDRSKVHLHPIQPDHYRAPEALLGTGWTYSADIWNLGVLVRPK